jgi:hypothetical protein
MRLGASGSTSGQPSLDKGLRSICLTSSTGALNTGKGGDFSSIKIIFTPVNRKACSISPRLSTGLIGTSVAPISETA